MSDDISTGELGRRLDSLAGTVEKGMGELRTAVEARPDWKDVQRVEAGILAKLQAEKNELVAMVLALTQRVAKGESWGTWGGRLVMGAVGLAAIAALIPKA